MNFKLDSVFVTIVLIVCQHVNGLGDLEKHAGEENKHEREKRFVFLQTAGLGYLAAIAIPLAAGSVNGQRVYMAVNFEAHYGLADAATFLDIFRRPFPGDDISQVKKRDAHGVQLSARSDHFTKKNNFYTRKNLYRMIEQNIDTYGYNGTACMLRTICETSEIPFHEYNGVFGNIIHILFSPSSSEPENIKNIYYEAEEHGKQQECYRYFEQCGTSMLDLVSDMILIQLRKMTY